MSNEPNDRRNAGPYSVTVDGLAIAVDVIQNGVPSEVTIAWIHGLGASANGAFGDVVRLPALAGTTSILIDLPGHGASDRADGWTHSLKAHATIVNRTLETIGVGTVTLVGHSMGRAIAISCAAGAPGRVERLILAEPSVAGSGRLSAHIAARNESRFIERGSAALVSATERAASAGDEAACPLLPSLRLASPIRAFVASIGNLGICRAGRWSSSHGRQSRRVRRRCGGCDEVAVRRERATFRRANPTGARLPPRRNPVTSWWQVVREDPGGSHVALWTGSRIDKMSSPRRCSRSILGRPYTIPATNCLSRDRIGGWRDNTDSG